ncbi:MAG: YceI family protein [Trueperaceae bacterium]
MNLSAHQLLAALVLAAALTVPASAQESRPSGAWTVEGEAVYEARDSLASWSGRAPLVSAELRFDPADPADLDLTAVVPPAAFDSNNPLRDLNARRTVFEVDDHPEARARATADPDAGPPRRVAGGWAVPIAVDLTLHGVTIRYAAEARLDRDGAEWTGTAVLTLSLEAHGMRRPRLLGIVTEDAVRLEVRVRARPAP